MTHLRCLTAYSGAGSPFSSPRTSCQLPAIATSSFFTASSWAGAAATGIRAITAKVHSRSFTGHTSERNAELGFGALSLPPVLGSEVSDRDGDQQQRDTDPIP